MPSTLALYDAVARAASLGVPCVIFHEPDDDLGATAAASAPLTSPACRAFTIEWPGS